jgi:hypothetical protein
MPDWLKNKNNKFDIDLKVGEEYEDTLAGVLKLGKVEVKTEIDKWRDTGNIVIEIRCRGKLSGLSVTEAGHWAHILSYNGDIKCVFLFPVQVLKKIVKNMVADKVAKVVMGGDDDESQVALLPIKKLKEYL